MMNNKKNLIAPKGRDKRVVKEEEDPNLGPTTVCSQYDVGSCGVQKSKLTKTNMSFLGFLVSRGHFRNGLLAENTLKFGKTFWGKSRATIMAKVELKSWPSKRPFFGGGGGTTWAGI